MLKAVGLTKKYGDHTALNDLNLDIAPGEIFCLLGANGAGKTTTINLFLDFILPSSGEALIDGKVAANNGEVIRRMTAYIPEQVALYGNLTGHENLAYFSELAGKSLSNERQKTMLLEAGLAETHINSKVRGYSKGMRQKVALAIAMAREARALLLDEPTSGLDPHAAAELAAMLVRLREAGTAVLMATHDIFRSREIATKVGIMKQGRLVARINPGEMSTETLESIYLDHMSEELEVGA